MRLSPAQEYVLRRAAGRGGRLRAFVDGSGVEDRTLRSLEAKGLVTVHWGGVNNGKKAYWQLFKMTEKGEAASPCRVIR